MPTNTAQISFSYLKPLFLGSLFLRLLFARGSETEVLFLLWKKNCSLFSLEQRYSFQPNRRVIKKSAWECKSIRFPWLSLYSWKSGWACSPSLKGQVLKYFWRQPRWKLLYLLMNWDTHWEQLRGLEMSHLYCLRVFTEFPVFHLSVESSSFMHQKWYNFSNEIKIIMPYFFNFNF